MKRCPQCTGEYPDTTQFCPRDGSCLESVDPLIGRIIGGRYRLIARVGKGGMGAVYRGEHMRMRRTTAIKVLNTALASSPEFVARFQREAELASTLSHPHAVAIYDFGDDEGLVYLAMEFLDGEPLSTTLVRERTLPLDVAVRVARQAAEALDAAHRRGIIHRDFKPDNVMMCGDGTGPRVVKVVDFGIAKQTEGVTGGNLTQTGSVLGTPTYMSPEQVADRPLDPRSDLYSLALVVYQMLSGTLPFRGDTVQSVMVMRLLEAPTPLRSYAPGVPPAVEAVVMQALAREPQHRQASVLDFVRDLEHAATTTAVTPISAGAVPTPPVVPPAYYQTPAAPSTPTQGQTNPQTAPASFAMPSLSPTPTPTTPVHPQAPVHYPPTPMPFTAPSVPPKRRGAGIAIAVVAVIVAAVVLPVIAFVAYSVYLGSVAPVDNGNIAYGNTNTAPSNQGSGNGDGKPSVEYLVGLARDLRDREEYEQAEERAREAVATDPSSASATAALADILLDQSKNSEGGRLAEHAVELDRRSATAHRVVATYALSERQFGKAVESAKKALELGPGPDDEAYANLVLGAAYSHQTLYDPALEAYNRAKSYSGGRAMIPVLARLGIADILSSKGNPEAAVRDLTDLAADAKLRPNMRALVNRDLAKLMLAEQKPAEALPYCEKALQTATLSNVRAGIMIIQGLAYVLQQKPNEALTATEAALKIAGEDRELQGYGQAVRGAALVLLGRTEEGRAALKMARQILPDDADIATLANKVGASG